MSGPARRKGRGRGERKIYAATPRRTSAVVARSSRKEREKERDGATVGEARGRDGRRQGDREGDRGAASGRGGCALAARAEPRRARGRGGAPRRRRARLRHQRP